MLLLLVYILPSTLSLPTVSVTPCCSPSEHLDISRPSLPSCKTSSLPANQSLTTIHVGAGEDRQDEIHLLLDRDGPDTMPDCRDGMEVHFFSTGLDIEIGLDI
jgi:hypothetical protein